MTLLREVFPSLILGVVLLASAVGLMVWHVQVWRRVQNRELEKAEQDYRRIQFRRRMQTTAILGLIAVALPIGVLVMRPWPKIGVFFWGGVLLLVVWVTLLAMADVVATAHHYGRLRQKVVLEEVKLQAELYRVQGLRRNGKPKTPGDRSSQEEERGPS